MKKKEKEDQVAYLRKRFEESEVLILADYRGLNVETMSRLRRSLREQGAEMKVVKNTLARLAVRDTAMAEAEKALEGPTAIVLHKSEPGLAARVLSEFAKKNKAMKIKGGVIGGKLYDSSRIEVLARLPGREQLLAILAGAMKGAPSRLLGVISAMPQKMAGLLLALKESREQGG